jgi:propane monooxygenase reductase component
MKASFKPIGEEFSVDPDEDILTAALRHGVNLQYGCRHGNCSSCKHWLLDGEVDDSKASVYAIPRHEREEGAILLCCTYPLTDIVVEIDQHDGVEQLPALALPTRRLATVTEVSSLSTQLVQLRVRLDNPMSFRAGQYIEFLVPGTAERRSFSLVNAPSSDAELTFCIKRVPDGVFSSKLDTLGPGDRLELTGPFGTTIHRDSGRPVLAAAIGSGIAPILSVLTDLSDRDLDIPIHFYYGARSAADLVYQSRLQSLSQRFSEFRFTACLSDGAVDGVPGARRGRVTRVMAQTIRDASNYDAYLCGPPHMCDAVRRLLEAKGAPENRIFLDRFYPAVPLAADR